MNPEYLKMKIPLLAIFTPSQLYQFTLDPDFDKSEHKEEILETLKNCEGVRPEDINKVVWRKQND